MVDMNPEALRSRFAELGEERQRILDVAGPMRTERDELVREHTSKIQRIEKRVATAEQGLFDIDQERGMIARALGGKTGGPEVDVEA